MKNNSRNLLLTILGLLLTIGIFIVFYLTTIKESPEPTISTIATPLPTSTQEPNVYPEVISIVYPIEDKSIPTYTFPGSFGQHPGIDFRTPVGTEVFAAAAGRVRTVGILAPFGYRILIDHNINGQLVSTMYGNLDYETIKVKAGDTVEAGDLLALTGDMTPDVSHLHYEIRILGTGVKPLEWLEQNSF